MNLNQQIIIYIGQASYSTKMRSIGFIVAFFYTYPEQYKRA